MSTDDISTDAAADLGEPHDPAYFRSASDWESTTVATTGLALDDSGIATSLTGTSSLEQYLWAEDVFAHVAAGLSLATQLVTATGAPA